MKIRLSPQLSIAFLSMPLAPVAVALVCLSGSSTWSIPVQRDSISTLCPEKTKTKSHRGIRMGAWMVWGALSIAASISGALLAGKGVPPRASLQTRAPLRKKWRHISMQEWSLLANKLA